MGATDRSADGTRSATIEIAHEWYEGDGKEPLDAMIAEFESRHPGMAVEDRSYANAGLSVKSRILQQNPPSVWVEWPGEGLRPYYEANTLRDLTGIWEESGMADGYLDAPRKLAQIDGTYAAVPVNLHRINDLFYDRELVERHGVDPARIDSPREFLEVLDAVADEETVGMELPMKSPWTVSQLFSVVVLGQFGPDVYEGITAGDATDYRSEISEALAIVDAVASQSSDDASFTDMMDANGRFLDQASVFYQQGDWMGGIYAGIDGYDYGSEWDAVPFPGTDGIYLMGMDSMIAARGADSPEATETFLEFVGSPTALEIYNRIKGAIPPRDDVSVDDYPPFLQDQYRDFTRSRAKPGSLSLAVTPEAEVAVRQTFAQFVESRDVDEMTDAVAAAYNQ